VPKRQRPEIRRRTIPTVQVTGNEETCSTRSIPDNGGQFALAAEGAVPKGVPHLDHVFLIMMENHGYSQIVNNPNAPFINSLMKSANSAHNYFAVGHPSLTNYLEVVGGSNLGVQSDNSPDWHDSSCVPNLESGLADTDNPPSPAICPISGSGRMRPHQLWIQPMKSRGRPA